MSFAPQRDIIDSVVGNEKCAYSGSEGGPAQVRPQEPAPTCDLFVSVINFAFCDLLRPVCPQMVRGRRLSDDLRWSILKMARSQDIPSISKLTGVGKRTVERLMSDYRRYGTVARRQKISLKGKRKLSTSNVQVCQPTPSNFILPCRIVFERIPSLPQ